MSELCFFVERVDHLAEQLFVSDTPWSFRLDVGFGALEKGVKFLVVRLGLTVNRLSEVAQNVEVK